MFSIALFSDNFLHDHSVLNQRFCEEKIKKGFFVVSLFFLLCSCATRPLAVVGAVEGSGERNELIHVVNRERHTGIVVEAAVIYRQLPELERHFGLVAYLEFGWGDRDYYQAVEVTTGVALKAAFLPTDSAIQVMAMNEDFMTFFAEDEVLSLSISSSGLDALVQFIVDSFERDENDKIVELRVGEEVNSQFYQATGKYHLFNTCNKWTAKGLRSAGMEGTIIFKLTAGSVMRAVESRSRLSHDDLIGSAETAQ